MNRDALLQTIYNWYGPITGSGHDIAALADTILALPYAPSPEVLATLREHREEYKDLSHKWKAPSGWAGYDQCLSDMGLLDAVMAPEVEVQP